MMMSIKILPESPSPTDGAMSKGKRPMPSSSGDSRDSLLYSSTETEEDEDMANCLILLARGNASPPPRRTEIGTGVYDCKTCDRTFPTFQALGGHRASHKRTKLAANTARKKSPAEEGGKQLCNKLAAKIRECSVCGSEFASGQALGGHMRRHRAAQIPSGGSDAASQGVIGEKPRSVLALDLDLNFPAAAAAAAEVDDKCNQQRRWWIATTSD